VIFLLLFSVSGAIIEGILSKVSSSKAGYGTNKSEVKVTLEIFILQNIYNQALMI
jgi:hypothetical protein